MTEVNINVAVECVVHSIASHMFDEGIGTELHVLTPHRAIKALEYKCTISSDTIENISTHIMQSLVVQKSGDSSNDLHIVLRAFNNVVKDKKELIEKVAMREYVRRLTNIYDLNTPYVG